MNNYTRLLLLLGITLLSACTPNQQDVCDDVTKARAGRFITQVLEQEATGLRLREVAAQDGRPVFYANVAYDRAEEPATWDIVYIRDAFKVEEVSCAPTQSTTADAAAAVMIDVRVWFSPGYWFDQEAYGEVQGSGHTYTLRLQNDKFKITKRLPAPFVSARTAAAMLGSEPYASDELLGLRKQLATAINKQLKASGN
jgi:hypothetical protein